MTATFLLRALLIAKIEDVSRKLGGDPPRAWYWPYIRPQFSNPRFWGYVRAQCRKPDAEELQALVRKAHKLVNVQALLAIAAVTAFLVAVKGC